MAMDYEKAIEFLLSQQARTDARLAEIGERTERRFDKIVNVLEHVVERQDKLDDALTTLVESQIRMQEELRALARATDERFRATDERFRATDERINLLVGAIGVIATRVPPAA